jgi:tetratricopeptide (TPR) repeat protein
MKNRNVTTGLLAILILAGAALPGRGQGDAKTAVPENLTQAAEAVKAGSESRAWNLLTQDPAAFDKYWASLDGSFLMWVADQYREQKRFADCQALLDRAAAKAGLLKPADSAQAQLIKGDMFRDQLNFAAARLEYLGLDRNTDLRGTPAGLQARFRLVEILRITKDYDAAEQALEKLRDAPDAATQAEAYYQAARLAFDRESFAETRSLIEEVKKRVPEHVEALFLEAELNLREDRLQDPDLEIGSRVMMTYVVPGRPITMKMQDRNLAVVRGGAGIPVEVQTSKGKDRELVTLLPSPRDPTLFRGTIPTRLGEAAPTNAGVEGPWGQTKSVNFRKSRPLDPSL